MLVLKADINAASGTPDGLAKANTLLNQASKVAVQESDKAMIQAKLKAIQNRLSPQKSVEQPPAPAPPAVKEAPAPAAPAAPASDQKTPAAPSEAPAHSGAHGP
jgi:hypothetical protein